MTTKTDDIRLIGGPMDGWLVKADAAALGPTWYTTWPATIANRFAPGSYRPTQPDEDGIRQWRWVVRP